MRFMLAFANPAVALEFCMVVQEAAMYLPWPAEPVLLYEGCTVERDVCNKIVFRGPRLKMGVCEYTPLSGATAGALSSCLGTGRLWGDVQPGHMAGFGALGAIQWIAFLDWQGA